MSFNSVAIDFILLQQAELSLFRSKVTRKLIKSKRRKKIEVKLKTKFLAWAVKNVSRDKRDVTAGIKDKMRKRK